MWEGHTARRRRHWDAGTHNGLLVPSRGKRGPEKRGYLPKVTQETVAEASRPRRISIADTPTLRAWPLQS